MRTAARTAALMAILTLGSKILGFAREVLLAGFFGTSYIVDAYIMAGAIPGILFAGIFGAVSVSYMPIFSKIVHDDGLDKGNEFTSETLTLITSLAIVVAGLGIIFAAPITGVLAKGFTGETARLTIFFLKISFAYVVFIAISELLSSYLQYKGVFLKPILAGYVQNIIIMATIVIGAYYNHYYLVFGLLIGNGIRMAIVAIVAKNNGYNYKPTKKIGNSARQIAILAVPVFIGSTVNQVNSFVDKMLASGLQEGSVSALNYGFTLINMVAALTISVIVTIIYPKLTRSMAASDYTQFNDLISRGMNIILILSLPFTLGAMLYSKPIVQLVFQRGAFSSNSTDLAQGAFFYYAIGLTFMAINTLLVKVYYAMEDTRIPVICGALGALVNISLNLILIGPMAHRGLALATSIAAIINGVLLYIIMKKKYPAVKAITSKWKIVKIGFSSIVSVGVSWPVYSFLAGEGSMKLIISLLGAVAMAGAIYWLMLKIFKIEELSIITEIFR